MGVIGVASAMLGAFMGGGGIWLAFSDPANRESAYRLAPWLVGGALVVKAAVAVWAFREGLRRGVFRLGWLTGALALYLAVVGLLLALAVVGPLPELHPSWTLVVLAALWIAPVGRFALAPLALEWNRRR